MFEAASLELRDDEDLAQEAIGMEPLCFCHSSERLRNEPELLIFALEVLDRMPRWMNTHNSASVLICAAGDALRDSEAVMMAAVSVNGDCMQHASERRVPQRWLID